MIQTLNSQHQGLRFLETKVTPDFVEPKIREVPNAKILLDADTAIVISCYGTTEFDEALSNFISLLESIKKYCNSSDVIICVKNELNFRYLIDVNYKATRRKHHAEREIPFIKEVREHLIKEYENVLSVPLFEADDLVYALYRHYSSKGVDTVVSSIDKDVLNSIEGEHYNYKKNIWHQTLRNTALKFKYIQCLSGDSADNIKGLPKVGPKTAEKLLEGCAFNEYDLRKRVVSIYKEYGFTEKAFLQTLRLVSLEQCIKFGERFALILEA